MATNGQPADTYDVAILGGGLAGLTLALQLKKARPQTSIFVAEKRPGPAPEAAFKVGESTVELSCNYFGEVVGMKDHLEQDQIHKCGLRFFFPAGDNTDLAERVELGPPLYPPVPSYQLDRGRFENEAAKRVADAGADLFLGAFIDGVELGGDQHAVTIVRGGPGGERTTVNARWVVDASGRAFILKRKLGLEQPNGHVVNSSWFRLAGGLDIEEWVPQDDAEWFERMKQRGWRRYSTNHLCGQGYWVWLIPLSSGPISIGIVADPRFHPWERMDTLEASLDWIREFEPQLGEALDGRADQVEDFLKIEDFSYSCKQVFSADRWALTGEAGAFLDPFYSPGSDYIAMSNTFISDLVTRELDGEDIADRAKAHEDLYLSAFATHLTFYEGQYVFWGNPAVMGAKITANNILYWGANALLFFHRKLTDVDFMSQVRPDLERIWAVNRRLEELFRQWHAVDSREWRRGYVGVTDFPALIQRHIQLTAGFDDDALRAQLAANADLMEAVAVLIFNKAASALGNDAPGDDVKIDPYKVSLEPDRWESDGLFGGSGLTVAEARQGPAGGLESCFADVVSQPALSPASRPVAKAFQKTFALRMGMVFMQPMIKLGVGGKGMHLLSVPDQESGAMQTTPVTVIENGGRWLVAPYGVTRWVRNARAAGWVELRRGRSRERLRVDEVAPEEGAPVLREYVQRVSMVRPYFDVDADAPPEAFASEVPTHPVFRIAGPAP